MTFSILIAHYNNWEYFQKCYQSITNQSYQNFEVVIVDDYSVDDSFQNLEILAKSDSRIKLFRNSENKKVGFTKGRCVEEAIGDICMFVDPDDMICETALEEIKNAYESNPSVIATYSKLELVDKDANSKGVFKSTKKIVNSDSKFFNINFEVAHLFSFKRESYFKTLGINPNLSSAVDQDLYLKLYEIGDFYFIDKILYQYRLHDKGVSQEKSKKEQLNTNWHQVLLETFNRRGIKKLYGKSIDEIAHLPKFIFEKENTFWKKFFRKLS